jgi:hypothetical protein
LFSRLGKLAEDNGCIFLLETKKKSLSRNRKFNLATLGAIRSSTRNFFVFSRSEDQKNATTSRFDIACKWKRDYRGIKVKDAWFILTDLGSLPYAIAAYKQRMGIEEMFRDYKTGGYNLGG